MKRGFYLLAFIIAVNLISTASAEILISQPGNTYNIKDEINLEIVLKPNTEMNDFLLTQLICNNVTFDIYRNYFNLEAQEEQRVNIDFLIDNSLGLGEEENCFIKAGYGEDSVESRRFDITRKISVGIDLAKRIWEPGEEMVITGTAVKMNMDNAEGFLDILIEPAGVSLSTLISNGIFNASLFLPTDHSGEQIIKVRAYEKDSRNEISNEGFLESLIEIRPTLMQIRVTLNSNSISPGGELGYKVELLDQGGNVIDGQVAVGIFKPSGLAFLEEIKSSGKESSFPVLANFTAGYWKIQAVSGEVSETKLFNVEEKKDLIFSLLNNTLVVTNVGNVMFEGPIEVFIGSESRIMQIKLDIGESKRYKLSAPEGSYQIVARNGEKEINFGSISLTGNAVGIGELKGGLGGILGNNWIIWVFLVLVIGAVALMFIYKKGASDALGLIRKRKEDDSGKLSTGVISRGGKFEAGVVLLNTPENLGSNSMITIERAVEKARDYGAGINFDGSHRIMLFAPPLTKKKDNTEITLKAANEIEEILREHNRRYAGQIKYGIGVNLGQIIAESKNGKTSFVSVGNAISLAKKLSKEARDEILVSEDFHRKTLGIGRFEKKGNYWKVSRVADRGKHEEFIRGFLGKQERDKEEKRYDKRE